MPLSNVDFVSKVLVNHVNRCGKGYEIYIMHHG